MTTPSPDAPEPIAELRRALRNMADAYERRIRTDCTSEMIEQKPWRCAEYIEAERLCQKPPFKLLINNEVLKRQIAADPDLECEAGALHPDAPEPPALDFRQKIHDILFAAFSGNNPISREAVGIAISDAWGAACSSDAACIPALNFEAWWIKHIRSDYSGMVGHGLASIVWQAASAAQAKRIADLAEREYERTSALATTIDRLRADLAAAEQRAALEHANGFAACREMAAKVAEGTLGWSESGDTRAQTIAAAIRALIATPAETEKK